MDTYLSLSGESPDAPVLQSFGGVGLLRIEYILRAAEEYILSPAVQERLADYAGRVAAAFAPRPVWVRQADLTTLEVNTLRGADDILLEKSPLLGLRGIKRGLRYPEAMRAEVGCLVEVAERYPNLHYMFCYLEDAGEFAAGRAILQELGWPNRIGTMIEIPSAVCDVGQMVSAGASNFLLGTNDMSSLLTGQQRKSDRGLTVRPALDYVIRKLRRDVPDEVDLGIAGYLTEEAMRHVAEEGYTYCSVHYADAPAALGLDPELFPDRDHMQRVKTLTKTRVAEWQQRYYRSAAAEPVSQDARISLGPGTAP
jgi:phosphoenolpyruvate synthase/pyruvate phosphate dikinase